MKLRAISLVIALVLLLGCSNGEIIENNTPQSGESVSTQATAGGTMTLAMHKPETLNPIKNRDNTVDKVLRLIFEPLFVIDENMKPVPNLAESYTINGNTVTLKLKNGVKWQDGSAVCADDVIYTINQLEKADLDTIYSGFAENITSCSKADDLTVKISYSKGLGSVGYNLCFPLIPKHYYSGGKGDDMKPLGNGSYAFTDYTLVKEMNLAASETGLKGRPYITNINVKIIPDTKTQAEALEAGVIDAMTLDINSLGSVSSKLIDNAFEFPTNQFEFVGFNMNNEMFSNVSVRQGFAHLIPREDIINDIYINKMTESVTPLNPKNAYTSRVGEDSYDFDINLANTLFSAGGKGFSSYTFNILVNSENPSRVESAKMMSEVFNSAGMHTGVEAVSFDEYIKRLSEGNFTVYLGGVMLEENLDIMSLAGSSGNINYGGYADVNMDKLIGDCNSAISEEGYKAALNELNKYMSTQLPVIGIGFKSDILVTTERIKGEKTASINNIYGNINNWYIG